MDERTIAKFAWKRREGTKRKRRLANNKNKRKDQRGERRAVAVSGSIRKKKEKRKSSTASSRCPNTILFRLLRRASPSLGRLARTWPSFSLRRARRGATLRGLSPFLGTTQRVAIEIVITSCAYGKAILVRGTGERRRPSLPHLPRDLRSGSCFKPKPWRGRGRRRSERRSTRRDPRIIL